MPKDDHVQVLRLIEQAVSAIQARYHPGRPMYSAMERLRGEIRQAQRAASAASRTYASH